MFLPMPPSPQKIQMSAYSHYLDCWFRLDTLVGSAFRAVQGAPSNARALRHRSDHLRHNRRRGRLVTITAPSTAKEHKRGDFFGAPAPDRFLCSDFGASAPISAPLRPGCLRGLTFVKHRRGDGGASHKHGCGVAKFTRGGGGGWRLMTHMVQN